MTSPCIGSQEIDNCKYNVYKISFRIDPMKKGVTKKLYLGSGMGVGTNICGFLDLDSLKDLSKKTDGISAATMLSVIENEIITSRKSFVITFLDLESLSLGLESEKKKVQYLENDPNENSIEYPIGLTASKIGLLECTNPYEINIYSDKTTFISCIMYSALDNRGYNLYNCYKYPLYPNATLDMIIPRPKLERPRKEIQKKIPSVNSMQEALDRQNRMKQNRLKNRPNRYKK